MEEMKRQKRTKSGRRQRGREKGFLTWLARTSTSSGIEWGLVVKMEAC